LVAVDPQAVTWSHFEPIFPQYASPTNSGNRNF